MIPVRVLLWHLAVRVAFAVDPPGQLRAKAVEELFRVDFDNTPGNCGYIGKTTLDIALNEAAHLYDVGVRLIDAYDYEPEAARLVDAIFGVTVEHWGMRAVIKSRYEKVRNWAVHGGPVSGPPPLNDAGPEPRMPSLFCYSDWERRHTLNDPWQDGDGRQRFIQDPYTGQQRPLTIWERRGHPPDHTRACGQERRPAPGHPDFP
jgi:hypothetical protein